MARNSEVCVYNVGYDGLCGAEAKFWYGPKWLCWEHYLVLTAGIRLTNTIIPPSAL